MPDERLEADSSRTVEAVHRTCEIIGCLSRSGGAGVTEIADRLGYSKATVHSHLATLCEHGYVRKNGNTYRLGYRFVERGERTKREVPIYETAKQELNNLAKDTGEFAQLMIEYEGKGIYLIKIGGENAIGSNYYVGEQQSLHYSAAGKTILAHLPEDRVHEIVDEHGLERKTQHTITDREALFNHLETILDRGYALSDEETAIGIRAVGVPILDRADEILGAISISGPVRRITNRKFEEEFPNKLMEVANIIEIQVNYHQ